MVVIYLNYFLKAMITSVVKFIQTGVAYSKHVVHLYSHSGDGDIQQQLEVWYSSILLNSIQKEKEKEKKKNT